jgi:hypothetical protein
MGNVEDLNEYKIIREMMSFNHPHQLFTVMKEFIDFVDSNMTEGFEDEEEREHLISILMDIVKFSKKFQN